MPRLKTRTFYPAVTFSVVLVGAVGLLGAGLRRFIPKPPLNAMAEETDPFLSVAGTQAIPWRKLNRESLAEARREGKPIYLVIGDASSRPGRLADNFALSDSEITAFIRRHYIPIRVDATAQPYMVSAFDPIQRAQDGWDPDYQIWYLTPEGKSLGALVLGRAQIDDVNRNVMGSAQFMLSKWTGGLRPDSEEPTPGESQREQAAALLEGTERGRPDFVAHRDFLLASRDTTTGAWPLQSGQTLAGTSLAFLWEAHESSEFYRSLDLIATSGMVDWVHGGFFSKARRPGWREVEFEKKADSNADLMELFAKAYRQTKNPLYRQIAQDTFDLLADRFAVNGIVRAYRFGDRRGSSRSAGSSFSPRFLNDNFGDATRRQLTRVFDLDPTTNPEMLPRVTSPDAFRENQEDTLALLEVLRRSKATEKEDYSEQLVASVSGHAVARMLVTARFLDDPTRAQTARGMAERLQIFRSGANDVLRRATGTDYEPACLADYLGYVDAMLEVARSFGDDSARVEAEAVFARAVELFSTESGAMTSASPEAFRDMPPDTQIPDLIDHRTFSTSARALELATTLDWMNPVGATRSEFCRTTMVRYGPIANQSQRGFSGFFAASLRFDRGVFGRVRGQNADELASEWQRQSPFDTIVPVLEPGPVRFEVIRPAKIETASGLVEAVELLRATPAPI